VTTGLGSFRVEAERHQVETFRAATGLASDGLTLPVTYPVRWLMTPEIRAALLALVPETDLALVHESQSFNYERPLRCGVTYVLSLAARREAAPDRLLVDGTIADDAGAVHARTETVLRLFAMAVAAA
jgi:hypothetical protein